MSHNVGTTVLLLRMLLLLSSLAASLPALAASTGQLRVVIIDLYGEPLQNVNVALSGETLLGGTRQMATDRRGESLFSGLSPSAYRIDATKPGFLPVSTSIWVEANRTAVQTLTMSNSAGNGAGAGAPVTTETTTTGVALSQDFLQRIPAGRTYQTAVQAVPGATGAGGNPNMGGSATNENTYMLDGANISPSPSTPPTSSFRSIPTAPDLSGGQPAVATETPPAPSPAPSAEERTKRMVHHNGWVALSVPNPRETLDAVAAIAERSGGRTEQMSGNTATIRVPVAQFQAIWEEVCGLGDVLNEIVRADDVTEQHTALDLRLRVLLGTRNRLVALLAQAKTELEKLRLLGEISRITEEIDIIASQLRTLKDLAAMSRITVQAEPREAFTAQGSRPDAVGFEWISALSPFRRGIWRDDHRVELAVPEQMVVLAQRGPLMAESSGGTALWTMRIDNDPIGTADFWIETIAERLSEEFAAPDRRTLGAWSCLSLTEPGTETPYRWEICVEAHGKKLHVAQTYLPDEDEQQRYGNAIQRAFAAAGGGS